MHSWWPPYMIHADCRAVRSVCTIYLCQNVSKRAEHYVVQPEPVGRPTTPYGSRALKRNTFQTSKRNNTRSSSHCPVKRTVRETINQDTVLRERTNIILGENTKKRLHKDLSSHHSNYPKKISHVKSKRP